MPANLLIGIISIAVAVLVVGEAGALRAIIAGFSHLRRLSRRGAVRYDTNTILKSPLVPAISVVVAPPDASPASVRCVHDLVKLHYGDHEVLAVLDGPSEAEMAVWTQEFRLFPSSRGASGDIPTRTVVGVYESRDPNRLMVIEKQKGGLADCLNVGLNVAGAQLVAVADARSRIAPETLLRAVMPFLEQPAVTVASCTAVPPLGEGPLAARLQALECLRMWLGRAAGLASRGVALSSPGAFAIFDRSALREANGFSSGLLEMLVHLHALNRALKRPYNIEWVHQNVVSPLPTNTLTELRRATCADQRELRSTVWRHLTVLGSLHSLGRIAMPGMLITGVVRPLLETAAYAAAFLGLAQRSIPWEFAALLVLATSGFGMLNSAVAVLLREFVVDCDHDPGQLLSLFLASIVENFGYRQLRNLWLIGSFVVRY